MSFSGELWSKLFSSFSTSRFEDGKAREAQGVNSHFANLSYSNTFISSISRAYRKGVSSTPYNIQSRTGKDDFDQKFEELIREWSKVGNCEIRGKYYRGSAEKAIVDQYAVKSGGIIIRHHYSPLFKFGYKFELIPLYMVDTSRSEDYQWVNGFKVNKFGEVVAVAIYSNTGQSYSEEVPAKDLTIVINTWADIVQYTGVAPVNTIKESLEYIDNYKAKEMTGAGNRAETPFIIKSPFFTQIMEAAKRELKDKSTSIAALSKDTIESLFKLRRLDHKKKFEKFAYISDDEDVVETGRGVFTIYNDMFINETGSSSSAIGLTPASTVARNESSYNAALKGAQSEEEEFKIIFNDVIELCWRTIIEEKLLNALVLNNHILAPNYWIEPSAYRKVEFMRRSKGHIDPIKTAKATTENILNKTTTIIDELAVRGIDVKDHIEKEIKYELLRKELFEKAGLIYQQSNITSIVEEIDMVDDEEKK